MSVHITPDPTRISRLTFLPKWARRHYARKFVRKADRLRDERRWKDAALAYRVALEYLPYRADLWVQYGHALKESGLIIDAELAYRISLKFNQECADTYLQLGHALKIQNRLEEARNCYKRAYQLDPHLPGLASEL